MSRRKGFAFLDALFACVLLTAGFLLASTALSHRVGSIAFSGNFSLLEEKALLRSEFLVKSCSGLAVCQNGFSRSHVIAKKKAGFGFGVFDLAGNEVFSENPRGFCVNRLAVLDREAVVVRVCA